ncbi:uncharacterized protein LOC107040175 [Diachasma alloeum]|uniref:uncharacterized protein LOC107040175 n=1 Tax=Diachasma alloeum TaxID=454923 RepID=UPI0007384764|nr:uncharacterized protein LOC107040175 [Diachasma alloeum]
MFQQFFLSLFVLKCALSAGINSHRETITTCGGDFSGYEYTVTSPNYPQNYPENVDCVYVLRGSPRAKCNQMFNLQFLDFSLRPSENCQGDFVEIGDRSLFCGSVGGIRRYPGMDNSLRIRFHSGKRGNGSVGRGFKITVTTLPCPSERDNSSFHHPSRFDENREDNFIPGVEPLTEEPSSAPQQISSNHIYPVYRPASQFTLEDHILSKNFQTADNPVLSVIPLETSSPSSPPKLFPANPPEKSHLVKNVNTDFPRPVKISSYFFASPESEAPPKLQEPSQLLSEQLPPTHRRTPPFRQSQADPLSSNFREAATVSPIGNQLSRLEDFNQLNDKIGIPAASYGLPGSIAYPQISDLKPGEVLDTPRDVDCFGKVNVNSGRGPSLGNDYPRNAFAPAGSYPATTYGQPGSSFLSPSNPAPPPPTQYLPSVPRPSGFIPTQNPGIYFPGIGARLGQCCGSLFSGQRFLLTSPGFPTLLYNGNSYECVYNIAPHSQNVCRLRLNFKFFNLGTEDSFCSGGHLEIDGRRYCGCKTGLSVVSDVPNLLVKTIGVRYMGLPRTKLNGFVMEVVQESCGYPVLARSKKDVGNGTFGHDDGGERKGTAVRVKRNLGYSYAKPNIPFDQPGAPPGHAGDIGHLGFTSSTRCQALSFIDWTLAAKEVYLKGARCTSGGGGRIPDYPNYPGGYFPPNYPGNGNGLPGYPGGNLPPNYPGNGFPNYPGGGNFPPSYPGIGTGLPIYPSNGNPGGAPGYPPSNGIPPNSGNCETVSVVEGIFSSPFYPSPYPNNVNRCWRFYRSPIGCRLQLSFLDFDVESSQGCVKDYLSISGQNNRFCGRTLAGSKTLLGFPTSNFIDIRFISDDFGTGKGFTIGFTQLPCQVEANR